MSDWNDFLYELEVQLQIIKKRKIIIYGKGRGADFVRWFITRYMGSSVKAWIDRWELCDRVTIPHLWALGYIYEEDDIIINCTPNNIVSEYNDTGENFHKTKYNKKDIVNLYSLIYGEEKAAGEKKEIAFYDWLEWKYGVDFLNVIRRGDTDGDFAHGYFPTDTRIFIDVLKGFDISDNDAVLDIGAGKGSGVVSLAAAGFKNIGAIEYTRSIFHTMKSNLATLGLENVVCLCGDAAELKSVLDKYNWFFLFNPFNWDTMERVLKNIEDSFERERRRIRIIYAEPICHNMIMSTGKYSVIARNMENYADVSYYTYIYEHRM